MTTIVAIFGGIVGLSLLPVIRFYIFRVRLGLKAKLPNAANPPNKPPPHHESGTPRPQAATRAPFPNEDLLN